MTINNKETQSFPLVLPPLAWRPREIANWLAYLNQSFTDEDDDCVRRTLRRKEFVFKPAGHKKHLPSLFTESEEK